MMRPKSIVLFEAISLLAVALGALVVFLTWGGSIPGAGSRSSGGSALVAATVIGIGLTLVLVLLTSRKASNIAKWILVLIVAVSFAMAVARLGAIAADGLAGIADAASVILQAVAIFFLFTAEARRWFATPRADATPDEQA